MHVPPLQTTEKVQFINQVQQEVRSNDPHCTGIVTTSSKVSPVLGFYCCDRDHDQKQGGGETVYFILKVSGCSPSLREVRARSEAEAMEEHCLLACSPWLAQSVFL